MCIVAATGLLALAGAGMSAMSAMNASKAQKQGYQYQAAVQRNNQQIAEWNAQDALERGQQAEENQRRQTAQLKGSQRAALAARGLDVSEGSALNLMSNTDFMGERDALTIRSNAARDAWGFRNQAAQYGADAGLYSTRAKAESPGLSLATSLIGSAGQVASSWYRMTGGGS